MGRHAPNTKTKKLRNLKCRHVQSDEIWSFCFPKDKNLSDKLKGKFGFGSVWTWTTIDADSKLMVSWLVGDRSADTAMIFMNDVAARLANSIQLTTDAHKPYLIAVADAFGRVPIDYAMLTKIYSEPPSEGNEKRYSPGVCCGTRKDEIRGDPDPKHISTSYAERLNLQIRMGMRRFTRLTNAHSKKIENHKHALALYFMYYNFARIHSTLPAPSQSCDVAPCPTDADVDKNQETALGV